MLLTVFITTDPDPPAGGQGDTGFAEFPYNYSCPGECRGFFTYLIPSCLQAASGFFFLAQFMMVSISY